MLSIKDQEHFLGLVEMDLARMSDKLSNPSTSADDLVHHTAPGVAKLRLRVAASIAQDKKEAEPAKAGAIQEEFSRLARDAFAPQQPEGPAEVGAWKCEDALTITLRRMNLVESTELNPQKVICTLYVNHEQPVKVSESEVIREAIDNFRRRANEVGAGGDRVDAQTGWSW